MIAAFLAPLLMGLERLTSPRLWKMASDLSGDGAITHLFLAARGFFAIDFFGAVVFLEKAEVSVERALARFHVSYPSIFALLSISHCSASFIILLFLNMGLCAMRRSQSSVAPN